MANYINNSKMYEVMREYILKCREEDAKAKQENRDPYYPEIPNYIGECFLLIADKLSNKSNFSAYPFIEEMKADAVENSVMYIRNFDPDKTQNPFAYFTQFAVYAFIRRIEKEKKQLYIKHKNYQKLQTFDVVDGNIDTIVELNDISNDYIKTYEERMLTKRKKAAISNKKVSSNTVTQHFVDDK